MKKVVLVLIALLLATTVVFAQSSTETVKETRPDVVDIKIWYSIGGANGEFFKGQVEKFLADHPEIKAELTYTGNYADSHTKISAARLANEAPDMIIVSSAQLYPGEDGNFEMVEFAKDKDFNLSDIQPGILKYAEYDGKLAALPFAVSTQVVYYNVDLVKKAGLDLEKNPPKTWAEFAEVCKKVIAANPGIAGFDTNDGYWLFKSMLLQKGNPVVEKNGEDVKIVFDNNQGVEVATFWKNMVDQGVMPAQQHDNAEKKFLAGSLAFVAATSNRISKWSTSTDFEISAIEMPYFDKPAVFLGGSTTTILTEDKWKADACWQVIKNVLSTDNQADFALASGYLPLRTSSLARADVKDYIDYSKLYKVATAQLSYADAYIQFGAMGAMDSILWYALDNIESGKMTPEESMKNAAKELLAEF